MDAQPAFSPHSFSFDCVSQPFEQKPPGKVTVGTGPPPMVEKHSAPATAVQSAFEPHGSPISPAPAPVAPVPALPPLLPPPDPPAGVAP